MCECVLLLLMQDRYQIDRSPRSNEYMYPGSPSSTVQALFQAPSGYLMGLGCVKVSISPVFVFRPLTHQTDRQPRDRTARDHAPSSSRSYSI